jgi:ABC-2 type transport system permease protein
MNSLYKTSQLIMWSLKQEFQQKTLIILRLSIYILILFVFSQIYSAVTKNLTPVKYVFLTQGVVTSFFPLTFEIFEAIENKTLSFLTNRPFSYLQVQIVRSTSIFTSRILITLLVFLLYHALYFDMTTPDPKNIALFFISAVLSGFIYSLLCISIGMLSFWIHDVKALFYLNMTTMFFLGGLVVPLESYPKNMQFAAFLSPYPWILWCPARWGIGQQNQQPFCWMMQIFWCFALFLLAFFIYQKMQKSIKNGLL